MCLIFTCAWPEFPGLHEVKIPQSVSQSSCSVMSDSLEPHGLQHTRLPCLSPTPGAYSNSCPFSWWCHPTISSSAVPFSAHLQSFPTSRSFPMSQFFTSDGQSIGFSEYWMWELDCEESWALKNWCFWTVVLEKTLESPLNCTEIKPVNPKENQS